MKVWEKKKMATYYQLKNFGEKLRKSNHMHLSFEDLRSMLMQNMNVHTQATIRHYLEILEEKGYLERVLVDNALRFEIIRIKVQK